jgi:glycolate oxidase
MGTDKRENEIVSCLEGIVGPEFVSTSRFEKIKQSVDAFPYHADFNNLPIAVVLPKTAQDISEILKYANKEKIPVYVRGSGTQLIGASRPDTSGIVIFTSRMNTFEIKEDYGYFESGPGVRNAEAMDMLAEKGYFLPLVIGAKFIASMGGATSNNTSAHLVDTGIGKPADYILAVEVVLPTGEIIETGTHGLRKPAGTDLTKWFVGGDGILGVITKTRMRLVPMIKYAYGIACFSELGPIARSVRRMYIEKKPPPIFMEFLDHNVATIGYTNKGLEAPPGHVIFFVSYDREKKAADEKMELLIDVFKKEHPTYAYPVTDMDEWKKVWTARESTIPFLMNSLKGRLLVAEIVSNLAQFEEAMEEGAHFNKGIPYLEDLTNYYFGHIGALAFHPSFIVPPDLGDERLREISNLVFQREAEFNTKYGTCGGEWGQFSKRKNFFIMRYGETSYELVKKIKATFDPNNILNPGVLEGYR